MATRALIGGGARLRVEIFPLVSLMENQTFSLRALTKLEYEAKKLKGLVGWGLKNRRREIAALRSPPDSTYLLAKGRAKR
jgi:hypothetical protein